VIEYERQFKVKDQSGPTNKVVDIIDTVGSTML